MKWDSKTYQITEPGSLAKIAYSLGAIGLAFSIIAYFINRQQFLYSWLVAFVFWTTISLGALFFVMLHHLSASTWSVVLRRITESIMNLLPWMIIPAIVILLNLHDIYSWAGSGAVISHSLLDQKSAFLNIPFFYIRTITYFVVWTIITVLLWRTSRAQDKGNADRLKSRFSRVSAIGMILFAFTCTFAAFDWLMSLEANWYSTIFGVYIFAGAVIGGLATIILIVFYLQSRQIMTEIVKIGHYQDLGKLLFAFVIFWTYMAFSQYLLIWYGNLPEETIWYLHRWHDGWQAITLIIVFGHFAIPFFLLMPYAAKRNPRLLAGIAGWLLLMHWVDIYWVAMPARSGGAFSPCWIDLATMIAISGLFIGRFWQTFSSHPLVPIGDPKLETSIHQYEQ
jgi:hypothetical protein